MDVQSITALLDELGSRFGATGEYLWGELVRYHGVTTVTVTLIAFGGCAVFAWLAVASRKRIKAHNDWEILMILAAAAVGVAMVVGAASLLDVVGFIASPDASTLHALLRELAGGR